MSQGRQSKDRSLSKKIDVFFKSWIFFKAFSPVTPFFMSQNPYQMTVDLNVLKHLGINLYSNIVAVLTEVVANAWDADAKNVMITIDQDLKQISIIDDGVGMTVDDVNQKFLHVGYHRREEDHQDNQFMVMGRRNWVNCRCSQLQKSLKRGHQRMEAHMDFE